MSSISQKLKGDGTIDRYAVLDAWRGVACILVLFYHCGASLFFGPLAIQGYVGVHLFFVLSGYLLYKPFATAMASNSRLPNTGNYLRRRFLRIYPPYLVSMIIFIAMRAVSATRSGLPSPANVLAHLGLVFNHGPENWYLSINGVYWTLAIEAQFYLLLPLSVYAAALITKPFAAESQRSLAWQIPLLFIAIGVLSRFVEFTYYTSSENDFRFRSVFSHLDLFGCGMLLTRWQNFNYQRFALLCLTAGFAFILASTSWAHSSGGWQSSNSVSCIMFNPLMCAFGAALAIFSTLNTQAIPHRLICLRPLIWIGVISYSVYLYHTGVLFFIFKLNLHPPGGWTAMTFCNAFVSFPIVLLIAYLMFNLIEKPCLSLIDRLRVKPTAVPITPAIDSVGEFALSEQR